MSAAEARRQAEAEGLTLVRSSNSTGYRGVFKMRSKFQARGGQERNLGSFGTAEEAALAYARHIGAEAAEQQMVVIAGRVVAEDEAEETLAEFERMATRNNVGRTKLEMMAEKAKKEERKPKIPVAKESKDESSGFTVEISKLIPEGKKMPNIFTEHTS